MKLFFIPCFLSMLLVSCGKTNFVNEPVSPEPETQLSCSSYTNQHGNGGYVYTVKHDNHLWVVNSNGGGLQHHPDCTCNKK
jgi:hypothetical protein